MVPTKLRRACAIAFAIAMVAAGCKEESSDDTPDRDDESPSQTADNEPDPDDESGDDTADEPDDDTESPDTDGSLAAAGVLADKVDAILEAYRTGDDVQAAAGDWKVAGIEMGEQFRKSLDANDAATVSAVLLDFAVAFPDKSQNGDSRSQKGTVLRTGIVVAGGDPALGAAGAQTGRPLVGEYATLDDFPDDASAMRTLASSVLESLQSSDSCNLGPKSDAFRIKKIFPESRKTQRLLNAHGRTDGALTRFCEATADTSKFGPPRFQIGEFTVLARDDGGEMVGSCKIQFSFLDSGGLGLRLPRECATNRGSQKQQRKQPKDR